MTQPGTAPLPDYQRPPVIEVVCGLQFEPLSSLQATALGLFWQRIRSEYPQVQPQPPLDPVFERLGTSGSPEKSIEIFDVPPLPRMFFIHKTPNWLIQLQKDRFLHNWRRLNDDDDYPRFAGVSERFWAAWQQFKLFCDEESLGEPRVNQLELTYINHILAGQGWDTPADVGGVFPDCSWRSGPRFLPAPESFGGRWSFLLPGKQGRLHVSIRHATRVADGRPVLLCELTARGMARADDDPSLRSWFELSREWIVRGFADLSSDPIQNQVWGRKA